MKSKKPTSPMQRISVTVDEEFLSALDDYMKVGGHVSISESIRDLARHAFQQASVIVPEQDICMASLDYAYNFNERGLGKKLNDLYSLSGMFVSSVKSQLQNDSHLEVVILKGRRKNIEDLAKQVIAQKGVKHGKLQIFPVSNSA
jgi:CopG family transcriptional regulator, nickel-responsive regulator